MSRKLVSYRLADDLQQALKERAISEGISATELVNRLLRRGLATDTHQENLTDQDNQVSRLAQFVHQLEKRVDYVADVSTSAQLTANLSARLQEVEKKLEELTRGMEEGCRSLQQIEQTVRAGLPQGQGTASAQASPQLRNPGQTDNSRDSLPPGEVRVSLKDLRQLLDLESQ
jgi:seryl-tRNA synthetase